MPRKGMAGKKKPVVKKKQIKQTLPSLLDLWVKGDGATPKPYYGPFTSIKLGYPYIVGVHNGRSVQLGWFHADHGMWYLDGSMISGLTISSERPK